VVKPLLMISVVIEPAPRKRLNGRLRKEWLDQAESRLCAWSHGTPHGPGNPLAAPITNCSWTPLGIYFGGCKAERCYFQSSSEPSLRYESLSYRLFLERYGVTQYEDSSSGRTLAESWKLSAVLELRIKSLDATLGSDLLPFSLLGHSIFFFLSCHR